MLAVTLTVATIAGLVVFEVALGGGEDRVSRLISEDRTHLSLCVDSAGGRQAVTGDVAFVQDALRQALDGVDPIPSEYEVATVVGGCPAPLELGSDRITFEDQLRPEAFLYDPTLISPHLLFVYLVPPQTFLAAFDRSVFDFSTSEYLCPEQPVTPLPTRPIWPFRKSGEACRAMSSSVYVPSDVSREDLSGALLFALGIREVTTGSSTDWQSCVAGSDAQFCEVYQVCIPPMRTSPEFCQEFWDQTGLERPLD
jgi:hypothetical protein